MNEATYIPGPNLPSINGAEVTAVWVDEMVSDIATPVEAEKPFHILGQSDDKDAALQARLRKYSATSGYARYTSMAADRIEELVQENRKLAELTSRIKAILAERNYKVHALTIENEHHKVNEQNLQNLIADMNRTCADLNNECDALADKLVEIGSEQVAAKERGLFATIAHYYRSK